MPAADHTPSTEMPQPAARTEMAASDDQPTIGWTDRPRVVQPVPADIAIQGYELIEELGRGGMGVVFKARQKELNRVVAVKMVLGGSLSSPEEIQRFKTEAEAAARLQHGNIVNVFDVGEAGGRCYYCMEYIAGRSLADILESGPMPGREAARILAIVARAIHHAHRNNILHRDLKPSNILIDADGQPHITDFGLAKKLDADSSQTRSGAIMGTPSYMPPEQASGRTHELGPASDVYGLGAILYEMLTGRPPFEAETALDTIRDVIDRQPAPPRLLNARVDRDLETICLKCLEKEPKLRYESALALAEDLERFLRGDSIHARTFNVLDRINRTLERDQYLGEFHHWGTMLLIFAGIVLVEHLVVFALTVSGPPYPRDSILIARFAQFVIMGAVFWLHRRHTLLPTTAAERQLYGIWIGYFLACIMTSAGHQVLVWQNHVDDNLLLMYPIWSILTGMAFFAMGSNYWGRFFSFGLAFFLLPALMALALDYAVLIYGLMWSGTLATLGLHLYQLGKSREGRGG